LELTFNDLLPVLSLIDSHDRKQKTLANNVATMTVVTAEDVKLERATEMVNEDNFFYRLHRDRYQGTKRMY
jgi:hypothetical protein